MGTRFEKLGQWLSHPLTLLLGFVGAIASILSVFFYFQSIENRELTFLVHPVKATVVKTGQTSRLKVSLGERELTNDVTAVQVAFWNAGKRPIKKAEILEPIIITTGTNHAILEATLKKSTRQLTHITLDRTQIDNGALGVSWDILERLDGGELQLVYAGDAFVPIQFSGIVEGQGPIRLRVFPDIILTPEEQYASFSSSRLNPTYIWVGALCLLLLSVQVFMSFRYPEHSAAPKLSRFLAIFVLICGGLVITLPLIQHWLFTRAYLPFEF